MKKCYKCKLEKENQLFLKSRNLCKDCSSEYNKRYYHKNIQKEKERRKKYYEENRELELKKKKDDRKNNPEKYKELDKANYRNRKNYILEYNKKYRIDNSEYFKIKRKEWRDKNSDNKLYKFKNKIRISILKSFGRGGYRKKSNTFEILGCSYDELVEYFESKFEHWMNWENRGIYNGTFNYGWDIDHIIPMSTAENEDDVIRLNHYTNLQPLCSKINRDIKKNKIDY